jgi:hypothetical protein
MQPVLSGSSFGTWSNVLYCYCTSSPKVQTDSPLTVSRLCGGETPSISLRIHNYSKNVLTPSLTWHVSTVQISSSLKQGVPKTALQNRKFIYILFRGHLQCFELSRCSKTHRVSPEIVTVQCEFHSLYRLFHKVLPQWYSKCYCVASVTKTFTLKGVQTLRFLTLWTM